jgi:carbonic anhydrase
MTCPNATAPVNIINNPEFTCDLKCNYSFKYPNTTLNIANRGDYLSFNTDSSNSPPVTFNSNKYEVTEMRLYRPSLHKYSGQKADAELVIMHTNVSSNGNLLVCVPIVAGISTSNPDSLPLFDTIISQVAKTANSPGSKTIVNIPTFTIDKLIPLKPYFSYSGSLPYSPCNGEYDYVVFSKDNGAVLSISANAFKSLGNMITSNSYSDRKNKNGVFYNKNGPSPLTGAVKGDIYMECLPTGSEGEQQVALQKTSEQLFNSESVTELLKNNWFLQILIGVCIMLGLTKLAKTLLNKLNSE